LFWEIAIVLFIEAVLLISVFRYRRARKPAPTKGTRRHSALEFAWGIAPALILLSIGLPAVYTLFGARDGGPVESLEVEVIGRLQSWEYRYPELGVVTADRLHLPVGRRAHLELSTRNLIPSFRVEGVDGEQDLIPGRTSHLWLTPDRTGVISASYGHPGSLPPTEKQMEILVVTEAEFRSWVARRTTALSLSPRR
jgi:cytochrome c oxidase subunit 2